MCCVQSCYVHTNLPGGPRRIESANVAQATMHLECDTFEKNAWILGFVCFVCSHLMTVFPCMVPILALEFCFTPKRISSCPNDRVTSWLFQIPGLIQKCHGHNSKSQKQLGIRRDHLGSSFPLLRFITSQIWLDAIFLASTGGCVDLPSRWYLPESRMVRSDAHVLQDSPKEKRLGQ